MLPCRVFEESYVRRIARTRTRKGILYSSQNVVNRPRLEVLRDIPSRANIYPEMRYKGNLEDSLLLKTHKTVYADYVMLARDMARIQREGSVWPKGNVTPVAGSCCCLHSAHQSKIYRYSLSSMMYERRIQCLLQILLHADFGDNMHHLQSTKSLTVIHDKDARVVLALCSRQTLRSKPLFTLNYSIVK